MPFWDTPLSLPEVTRCIPVQLPDDYEWVKHFLGALDDLSHEYNWRETDGGLTVEQTANRWRKIMLDLVGVQCEEMIYPNNVLLLGSMANKLYQVGTLTTEQGSTYMLGQRTYINPSAVGGTLQWSFVLAAGSYIMRTVIHRVNSSNGVSQADWTLDGNLVIDNMSFLGGAPNIQIDTPITIENSGMHYLLFEIKAITGSAQPAPIHYIQITPNLPFLP